MIGIMSDSHDHLELLGIQWMYLPGRSRMVIMQGSIAPLQHEH
jgi:hypothetical protein